MKKFRKIFKTSRGIGYLGHDPERRIYSYDFGFNFTILGKMYSFHFGIVNFKKSDKISEELKKNGIKP